MGEPLVIDEKEAHGVVASYIGQEIMPVGVVVERRASDHPWLDYSWHAVSVIPKAPALDPKGDWRGLVDDGAVAQFHAGTLDLSLFRKETEGYKLNLSQHPPRLWVVLRRETEGECPHEVLPFHVTADPMEAQIYLDTGDDLVDPVVMPDVIAAWMKDYVDRHHVDRPFHKRKRTPHPDKQGGGHGFEPTTGSRRGSGKAPGSG
ncbi:DUF3305 domain-containing protein [Rhodovibrio salinarum]|uniref:DUF3305 domain-containing protein n=1 Tax=Rhodovibrio salinarum TaxID=1087 RepID=A0A934QKP8_9PROT|nr:DUF3305 domain-containing protein [Rhodovibrio salinarum]MBK1698330.1 DUF3305 domain-containing protein [Rhodovibrio salinarum]